MGESGDLSEHSFTLRLRKHQLKQPLTHELPLPGRCPEGTAVEQHCPGVSRLEAAWPGQEVITARSTSESSAEHKGIYWSYKTQGNSEHS